VDETLNCLSRLVAFPTISRDSNLPLIEYVQNYLNRLNLPVRLFHNEERTKASLYCGIGPPDADGIILSGHTDVVSTEGQHWSSDPFCLQRRGERLFGRGTADMKGFVASVLAIAGEAAARPLRRPLHIALSYDEEIGCVGVRPMLAQLATIIRKPALAIVGEPTQMRTAVAHKGKVSARIHCSGHACHSSHAADGLNAIYLATDMTNFLREFQTELINADSDTSFATPYTTLHIGKVHGGTALNIVPATCTLDFEIRYIPADDPLVILERLTGRARAISQAWYKKFPQSGIRIEVLNAYPGLQTPPQQAIVRLAGEFGRGFSPNKLDFGTEGGLFHCALGVPVVICGPGDMDDAHKGDEFVALDQLVQCHHMLRQILNWLECS
jgi:acetylornithine deacetylase